MRVLIIASGDIKDTSIIKENMLPKDVIVCCDGGIRHAFVEGLTPHHIIGDLDSSSKHMVEFYKSKNVNFLEYDTKKDETDMELAINFAISIGAIEILILGAIGCRIDHTLTNINLLMKASNSNVKAIIRDGNNDIHLVDDHIEITGTIGDLISLIPLSSNVMGVTTQGLEYPLIDASMNIGNSLGVSNVMTTDKVSIDVKCGHLLVIKSRD